MAFLVIREKMKKNLKNSVLFILAAAIVILVLSVFLASSGSPSAIDVKGTSTSQGQTAHQLSSKPVAELNDYENAVAALLMTTG